MNKPLIELQNVTMRFGGLVAVDKLSFTIHEGEIFGLIGPNGAGKTTVFNCITQFYKPTHGDIIWLGGQQPLNLTTLKPHEVIKTGLIRTFQNVELAGELTVLQNLMVTFTTRYKNTLIGSLLHLPTLKAQEKEAREKALNILSFLGLYFYKDAYPTGLPYGILKSVELARTLMIDPKLIILDEPAAGLNDTETLQLAKTIRFIRKAFKTTILLVEHDMGLVMDVCDRIAVINFGKLIGLGTPEYVQSLTAVREAYLGSDAV
jgi:branched-chain amino acid transport system ATP-binding protein